MSELSSSDDECEFTKRRANRVHAKCWECGKRFRHLSILMSHYKSHDITATCHICRLTFRRLTSLSTHLDNAHSPPFCRKCHQSFSNVWEMNKHNETHCLGPDSLAEEPTAQLRMDPQTKTRQRLEMRPNTSENSVEYIVGEDDCDIDMKNPLQTDDSADESSSTDTDEEDVDPRRPADAQSNDDSSSTDHSSDSSSGSPSKENPSAPVRKEGSFCSGCGRGPFRSVKIHLLHCTGVKIKHQCSRCKAQFPNAQSLKKHYFYLYSCDNCGQVFSNSNSGHHSCSKSNSLSVVNFCSESMPKVCSICKAFFISEKALLNHVNRVHTSLVRTKLCIIPNSSMPTGKVSPGDTAISSGHVLLSSMAVCQNPSAVKQVVNGKVSAGQTYTGTLPVVKSSPLPLLTPSHNGTPPAPAVPVQPETDGGSTGQLSTQPPASRGATTTTPVPQAVSPPGPTILAMFENDSQEMALMKRMNMGWRSKAPHPCRQCGAVLRQPSLAIIHRYLHRGRRSHRCQCGRAFKHRLHLLRHCLEHAEAVNYICVNCGETFTGAKLFAEHLKGKSRKKPTPKHHRKKACRTPLMCDCGQLFFRPSAYIWHQLQNKLANKQLNKSRK